MSTTKTTRVAALVPDDHAKALQRLADAHDRSLAAEVRRALREYVERAEQREAKAS